MPSASDIKAMYSRALQQSIVVRRYTGDGNPPPKQEATCRGNAKLYGATELVGTIEQGDQKVILYADDCTLDPALSLFDKLVLDGDEFEIRSLAKRKALDGTLIAYEIQARGL